MAQTIFACPLTRGERILVAIDGSFHSAKAFEQTGQLACTRRKFPATGFTQFA